MTKSRRTDRYSTHRNACIVYQYVNERLDEVIHLFRIPGFHHAKFRHEFKGLSVLSGQELSLSMHQLFVMYDKSQQEPFDKFKAKLRRYLFNRSGNISLKVSNINIVKLEEIGAIEGLKTTNEIIEFLLFQYRKKDISNLNDARKNTIRLEKKHVRPTN